MSDMNCPNCGQEVHFANGSIKMTNCQSCGTSLFVEGTQLTLAGETGDMFEAPSLFQLDQDTDLLGKSYHILGHARFSYGKGWWDEYFAMDGQGLEAWISVDEGDIALQHPVDKPKWPDVSGAPKLGTKFNVNMIDYTVTEAEKAECVAVRGSFSERMHVGDTYRFVNCLGSNGTLLSGEFWTEGRSWYTGKWIDPFDVEVKHAS